MSPEAVAVAARQVLEVRADRADPEDCLDQVDLEDPEDRAVLEVLADPAVVAVAAPQREPIFLISE